MVWGKTGLVFIKSNDEVYRKIILERHVKQISGTFMKGRNWTFQQYGGPAHTAKLTQEWLTKNVPSFLNRDEWPPSTPDLNPCGFYLRGRLEQKVNNRLYNSIQALMRALTHA